MGIIKYVHDWFRSANRSILREWDRTVASAKQPSKGCIPNIPEIPPIPEKQRDVASDSCEKCDLLFELYDRTPKSNRDYWVMTELFVMLHGGDVCSKPQKKNRNRRTVMSKTREGQVATVDDGAVSVHVAGERADVLRSHGQDMFLVNVDMEKLAKLAPKDETRYNVVFKVRWDDGLVLVDGHSVPAYDKLRKR